LKEICEKKKEREIICLFNTQKKRQPETKKRKAKKQLFGFVLFSPLYNSFTTMDALDYFVVS